MLSSFYIGGPVLCEKHRPFRFTDAGSTPFPEYHLGRQVICAKLLQYRKPEYPASGTADRLESSGLVCMFHVIELLPCKWLAVNLVPGLGNVCDDKWNNQGHDRHCPESELA